MNSFYKNVLLWGVLAAILFLAFDVISNNTQKATEEMPFSEFMKKVDRGEIREIAIIKGKQVIRFVTTDNKEFETFIVIDALDSNMLAQFQAKGIRISVDPKDQDAWYGYVLTWLPMVLFIGIWIFFMRQMQLGGNKALSFGKSRAKLLTEDHRKVTFKDVAGVDEAREELQEIIEFLKDPQKFQKLGGKIPKGVLLVGPPGTGKTLLARAIAGEADVPFLSISGSDFVEMFVGVGASRVRDLFEQGKKNAPCIIFIDEMDAVGRHRGAGLGGGHDEREQTLNQLLVEMDGFESNEGVIMIAATNRPDVLDPALLRPGRFDRQVVVARPDVRGRKGILDVHTRNIPLADDVDLNVVARGTPGFSGADLANLVNEAALLAARYEKPVVDMKDMEEAKDKVLMGKERRSIIISDEDKRVTAYHEAGHALIGKLMPDSDPVHKVTIIPRGYALGLTQQLPEGDRQHYTKRYCLSKIATLLGGRVAEELALDDIATGASDDLKRATELARKMVCEWGMSETMGPLVYGEREEQIFLGREISRHQDYSEETAVKIDKEVRQFIMSALDTDRKILSAHIESLHALAQALLEKESLDGADIDRIVNATKPSA
ncbi:cell division protein FtsH / ATP-dependent zinc-metallo protease [Candidatus Moduliflexus flocculans]|uniref:ATP-dependent zinc metalloprotease FtsH n=1 Tax=Candidatus Moduliflexus flocculans TaxID=1499966 RepID=A0A0S6VUA2_9BACT|nr:cell division protein FtsH / ATP-dependent zinc-metallo protease [Candidatus Moduliflexus flocculans]